MHNQTTASPITDLQSSVISCASAISSLLAGGVLGVNPAKYSLFIQQHLPANASETLGESVLVSVKNTVSQAAFGEGRVLLRELADS
ncbi:MAG: hypothetical protein HY052_07235 [Proteobacteria bacterium]|nr:hypothetical protein [Pseudomonadota bacterium]